MNNLSNILSQLIESEQSTEHSIEELYDKYKDLNNRIDSNTKAIVKNIDISIEERCLIKTALKRIELLEQQCHSWKTLLYANFFTTLVLIGAITWLIVYVS
jgi:hypothetical protein